MSAGVLPAFAAYGVELEYIIVDAERLDPRPIADTLLASAAGGPAAEVSRGEMGWSNELALHVLEIKNRRPHARLEALPAAFRQELHAVEAILGPLGARLMPGGMHPWMDPRRGGHLWEGEHAEIYRRYDRIFGCQDHGWVNLQSMHLNLPFADDEEFARLHAAVRLALPILPALAASSPFAEGRATGWMDFRLEAYRGHQARLPSTMGMMIPESCASPAEYRSRVLAPMYREAAPHDPDGILRHEWLNARAAIARFDRHAIEIRILDTQECPEVDLAIAAATVALVRQLYEKGRPWLERDAQMDTVALAAILAACIRDAECTEVTDRHYLALLLGEPAAPLSAGALWTRLIDRLVAEERLDACWRRRLDLILERGPLARRILAATGPAPSPARLAATYGQLCECLRQGRQFEAQPVPSRACPV